MKAIVVTAFISLVFCSCGNSTANFMGMDEGEKTVDSIPVLQVEEISAQVSNTSKQRFENEEYVFECSFIPSIRNLMKQELPNEELKAAQENYARNSSFLIELKAKSFHDELLKYKLQDRSDYAARIEYFSFHANKDLRLITEEDTILCTQHHFERAYGIAPSIRLSIHFPYPERKLIQSRLVKVEFFDRTFGQGIVNFAIDPNKLKTYTVFNPKLNEEN